MVIIATVRWMNAHKRHSSNVGKIHFASIQGATSFASSFPHIFGEDEKKTNAIPCLIPCAIDQDPYFRLTRDCAVGMKCAKPALIHMRFLDALQGPGSKMSASDETSAIFMSDTAKQIQKKISRYRNTKHFWVNKMCVLTPCVAMPSLVERRLLKSTAKRAVTQMSMCHTNTWNFSWKMTRLVLFNIYKNFRKANKRYKKLKEIYDDYRSGKLLTSEV